MFVRCINTTYVFFLVLCLNLSSCASTSITKDWALEQQNKTYKHPMIIAITDSQQTRQIYEKYFVSELKHKNIASTPSYKLISSKQTINQQTVLDAIVGTDIDSVLVSYLMATDSEMLQHDSPINKDYSGKVEKLMISDTLIANRGRSNSAEIVRIKNDFYGIESKKIVWSVQTRTVAPESIDQVVIEVTELLAAQLFSDNLLE